MSEFKNNHEAEILRGTLNRDAARRQRRQAKIQFYVILSIAAVLGVCAGAALALWIG